MAHWKGSHKWPVMTPQTFRQGYMERMWVT